MRTAEGRESRIILARHDSRHRLRTDMTSVFNFTFVPWFRSVAPYIQVSQPDLVIGLRVARPLPRQIAQHCTGSGHDPEHGRQDCAGAWLSAPSQRTAQGQGHAERYSHGMRITDEVALDCAQEAAGQLRYEIEAAFSQGLPNTPMAGSTVRVISGNPSPPVRWELSMAWISSTGLVRKVDVAGISRALDMGALALISPFGFSPTGEAFNLAMEEVGHVGGHRPAGRQADFVTEVPGIRVRPAEAALGGQPHRHGTAFGHGRTVVAPTPAANQPTDTAFYLQHCVKAW